MYEVGGLGRLVSEQTRAFLEIIRQRRMAATPEVRAEINARFDTFRLQRVLDAVRERSEYLTIDFTTGGAVSVIASTLTTNQRLERDIDLFGAGVIQVTAGGLASHNFHVDLRHSRENDKSFFVTGESAIERAQIFDLFDSSTSVYNPLRELPLPITLQVGEYLTLDLYHDIVTPAPVRTLVIFAGRSVWPSGASEGILDERHLKRVREVIARRPEPQTREIIATFDWEDGGAQGGTAEFRTPLLNEPVLVRALFAPTANFTTINRLRVGENGRPLMSTAIPLRLIAQAATGAKTTALVHPQELPVPIFLPPGERLYADLANSIEGDGAAANFDADDTAHSLIKLIIETM